VTVGSAATEIRVALVVGVIVGKAKTVVELGLPVAGISMLNSCE
jgi:hypothetical protein